MSLAVSAGAVSPPPSRLMPLLFDSTPPCRTVEWTSRRGDAIDVEHDLAVVEQQDVARLDVLRQLLVVQPGARLVAEVAIGIEDEAVARLERDACRP